MPFNGIAGGTIVVLASKLFRQLLWSGLPFLKGDSISRLHHLLGATLVLSHDALNL